MRILVCWRRHLDPSFALPLGLVVAKLVAVSLARNPALMSGPLPAIARVLYRRQAASLLRKPSRWIERHRYRVVCSCRDNQIDIVYGDSHTM